MIKHAKSIYRSVAVVILALLCVCINPRAALASYDANNLIDNAIFTNKDSMSQAEIQAFLVGKYSYLASYSAPRWNDNVIVPASQIIYQAAQDYSTNPQVILATLQKEQSLVTNPSPSEAALNCAMGYASCSRASGFGKQVDAGTWQLRANYDRAGGVESYNYTCPNATNLYSAGIWPGATVTFYNPGGVAKTITIANAATASLYCYTPHVGPYSETGYSGSYNFVTSFEAWFGSTVLLYGINLTRTAISVDESGRAVDIGVSLTYKPAWPVEVRFNNPDSSEIQLSSNTITVQPNDWNIPSKNILQIKGVADDLADGSIRVFVQISSVGSLDPAFDKMDVNSLINKGIDVINMDKDSSDVYRLFNSSNGRHYFTVVISERDAAIASGYTNEGTGFYYCKNDGFNIIRLSDQSDGSTRLTASLPEIASAPSAGLSTSIAFSSSYYGNLPVYRLYSSSQNDYFYTTSTSEKDIAMSTYGYQDQGISFNACNNNYVPIYRLYRPSTGSHFYTTDPAERDAAQSVGYIYESVGFYAQNDPSGQTIYRLYRPSTGSHFYTTDPAERDAAQSVGYIYESVGFYAQNDPSGQTIYRLYRPSTGSHFYTTDPAERDAAQSVGYIYESVGFYSL